MPTDNRSFLDTPLLASAVLVGVLSVLVGQVGIVLKTLQTPGWEFLLQVGFVGGALSLLIGGTWAVRELWRYATRKDRETKSV